MSTVLQIEGLRKTFDKHEVLKDLNWSITAGSVIGLLGRNGAGKSTLIETILGLREAEFQRLDVFGESASSLSDIAKAKIGFVPQKSDLFEWLTPSQLFDYFARFYPKWNKAKVTQLLGLWDLDENKVIKKFSAGQKQILSIIRAMAHEPELLILDEPVAALDPAARREFLRELMNYVLNLNTTVIFSTHIMSDLERIAGQVAILHNGQIVMQQNLDDLIDQTWRVVGSHGEVNALLLQHPEFRVLSKRERDNGQRKLILQASREGFENNTGCRVERMNLEDFFIEATEK